MRMRGCSSSILLLLTLLCYAVASLQNASAQSSSETHLDKLIIQTHNGKAEFQVEVMRTDEERERGLMFRRYMPQDRGMLFDFKPAQSVMMWMKNTYIPLDMLFIGGDGHILNIAEHAEPLSERIIPSGAVVSAVLELNAGTVARLHIEKGDRVDHALFH
jgi:uncharacterized protein